MGNDYEQRKHAKKRRRPDIDPELASEGGKRDRKKRPAIRRNCKGMCYNEPQLTEEDKEWAGNASDEEDAPVRERRLAQAAITELNRAQEAEKEKMHAAKAKRKRKQSGQRLSTAVNLISPDSQNTSAVRESKGLAAERDTLGEAMMQFPEAMQQYMLEEGFLEPMPIQERCWPLCLDRKDLAATAEPGSGKTLGYLLPAIPLLIRLGHGAESQPPGPIVLILVPTRELAMQVATVGRTFRKLFGVRALAIIGGAEKSLQVEGLSKRPHIVVATPGRLLDLADEELIDLGSVRYVVLDEADKMLGLGLLPQLERLRKLLLPRKPTRKLPGPVTSVSAAKRPQVVMFSATTTEEAEAVAAKWLRKPHRVHVGTTAANISRTVVQAVQVCAEHKKPQKLLKHLLAIKEKSAGLRNPPRVLIFANRVKTVRVLAQTVTDAGLRVVQLHGDRSQPEREEALRDFRGGKTQVLVATDVAARGLHIRGLPYVINYDFPSNLEQYIHRAGRTGRLASNGHCFSFFTRNMAPLAQPLLNLLQEHNQAVDPNLVRLAEAFKIAAANLDVDARGASAEGKAEDRSDTADDVNLLADLFGADAVPGPTGSQDPKPAAQAEELEVSSLGNDSTGAEVPKERSAKETAAADFRHTQSGREIAGKHRKSQSLPGRLRKKVAKEKAAQASVAV